MLFDGQNGKKPAEVYSAWPLDCQIASALKGPKQLNSAIVVVWRV
jgi:hypothetical protein